MGFFKDRKVKKFAEKVAERENTIFIFGSDIVTENFVKDLVNLGVGGRVALIAEEDSLWIDEVEEQITILVEKRKEEYDKPQLFNTISFSTAEKIIILHKDPGLVQSIVGQIKHVSHGLKIILIAQNAPPFIKYLSEAQRERFIIVDNIYQVTTKLYKEMKLNLVKPPIITVPVCERMFGMVAKDLEAPNSVLLRVVRKHEDTGKDELMSPKIRLKPSDRLMLYLLNDEATIDNEFIKFFE
ncbi:MAG: hypothetical protein HeimC3_29880 [Candidatus Heimdallarchaeota archaeon LC_3]|nr:MAG: hypothetical protein HeimC3_29880 [Candidatus Heimdallarchaeota archaeon LC_3]